MNSAPVFADVVVPQTVVLKAPTDIGELKPIKEALQRPQPKTADMPLTPRESQVSRHIAFGLSNKEIADKLFISPLTVKGHLKNIYQKLEVGKRREAVEKAQKIGILSGGL